MADKMKLSRFGAMAISIPVVFLVLLIKGCSQADLASEPGEVDVVNSTDEFKSVSGLLGERDELPGATLFKENCAICHNGAVYKAPHVSWLEMMPARNIFKAMDGGIMATQASPLSQQQKIQVVEYLVQEPFDPNQQTAHYTQCEGKALAFDQNPPSRIGWGHDTSRFVPGDIAGLKTEDIPKLKLKWAFAFPGAMRARSQPSVGLGAVFVGSEDGTVYAFDLATGCVRWAFEASAEVRTGIVLDATDDGPPMVFFGDIIANVYGVNALTGELVWKRSADDHPSATLTGTPAIYRGVLYVPVSSLEVIAAANPEYECCTFRGKVMALQRDSGKVVWQSYTIPEKASHAGTTEVGTRVLAPSGAPVWTSPTIDPVNGRLYHGTGENYSSPADDNSDAIVAVDLETGKRLWHYQVTAEDAWNVACMMADNPNCPKEDGPDFDQGSSPLFIRDPETGAEVIVAGHKNGSVSGHDPETGKLLWLTKVGRGSIQGGVHFGLAAEGSRIYVPINDMNNTRNGDVLDPEAARPGISAVDAFSGELLWQYVQENRCGDDRPTCDPGVAAPATAIPGAVFAGHLDGFLRAYHGETGEVLWEYDTAREITGINGVKGRGGSITGAGPMVADGHVITNSGYGLYFHEPGNLLLVFAVQ